MTRKEKKELLKNLEEAKRLLKTLQSNIDEKNQNIESLNKKEKELEIKVEQYKKYFDLQESIKMLEDKKQKLENDVNFSYDVSKLAFAEYSVTREDVDNNIYNLGIFEVSQTESVDDDGYHAVLYKNIFNPRLFCGFGTRGVCSYNVISGNTVSIKNMRNVVAFCDVLMYMNDPDLLTKNTLTRKDLVMALQFLTENASYFGLEGYADKAKLFQKSKK